MTPEYRAQAQPINRQEAIDYGLDVAAIERLIVEREEARRAENWAVADLIRSKLQILNVKIEDFPRESTYWYIDHMRLWRKNRGW